MGLRIGVFVDGYVCLLQNIVSRHLLCILKCYVAAVIIQE